MKSEVRAKKRKLPVYLSKDEVDKFLAVIPDTRDLFLFRLLYGFGLRVSECLKLNISDFDLKEKVLKLRFTTTKRHKERIIPIPAFMLPHLKNYFSMVGNQAKLFSISRERVWQLTKNYGKLAKINKKISPHTFRHTYASAVYGCTNDINLVKELLGHANIGTTLIYTHMDVKTLKTGIDRVEF